MAKYDLRALRIDHGINQVSMAEKLEVTQGFISRLEQGYNPMSQALEEKFRAVYPEIDLPRYEIDESKTVLPASDLDGNVSYKPKASRRRTIALQEVIACLRKQDMLMNEALQLLRDELESERKRCAKLDERCVKLNNENRDLLIEKMQKENTILKLQMRLMQAGIPLEL